MKNKILPPAELSPRVVPRSAPHVGDLTSRRRSDIRAEVIHWRDLVLATWQLDDDHKFEGVIPEGMTIQRFSAKVAQAAGRLGGRVGVAVRGRRWWTWTIERPVMKRIE